MLRDRYAPMDLCALGPALGIKTDPVLTRLDALLDDDRLFRTVRADLARRSPRTPIDGRPSTPVEVVLRMLVVKHLYGWSYEQTEHGVSDSLVLRQFCRIYTERVPDDTTLLRWANTIRPATLHQLLDHVVGLARQRKVTRGRKLRVDSTVVGSNIHFPVDSTLLGDGARVLNRAIQRARRLLPQEGKRAGASFRDRTRSIGWVRRQLINVSRRRGELAAGESRGEYRRLISLTQRVVLQAQQVRGLLAQRGEVGRQVAETLDEFTPRVERVIAQTRRRVLEGESVPAGEKLVSIFEPHTAIIRKGKLGHPVECGRVLWLDETEGGIISRYAVLAGNPDDAEQVAPSLDHHIECFGHVPGLLAGDRKVYSKDGERYARDQGGRRVVLPQTGRRPPERVAYETERWFQRGRRWRAGIEGRISVMKRRDKLARCLYHGSDGMERWVGWGVIAHNLHKIAEATR